MDIKAKESYLDAVKRELSLFEELGRIIEKEKKELMLAQRETVEVLLKEKENIIESISLQEHSKAGWLSTMAKSLNISNPDKATLTDVVIVAEKNDADEVESSVEGLLRSIEKISGANAGNARMTMNFLNLDGFMKRTIKNMALPKQITYSIDGEKQFESSGPKKLDIKF